MRVICLVFATAVACAQGPVSFREHLIASDLPSGYSVMIADINHDGRPDVVGLAQELTELAWFENPGWQRHVLVKNMPGLVNMAAANLDPDGIPAIAFESGFSMVAAKSPGLLYLLRHNGDVNNLWTATKIDELPTSHHVAWADIDGCGKKELINAPLIGLKALAPTYDDKVSLVYYRQDDWKRMTIDNDITGILHRVHPVHWDGSPREQLLTAGFDGIRVYSATGPAENLHWHRELISKGHEAEAPHKGTSDVAVAHFGSRRFLAAVEPWHGNEVVVYTEEASHKWHREVIFSELSEGHEVAVGDFNGDGLDDIAVGDRGKNKSVHVFFAKDDTGLHWDHRIIDNGGMAGSSCVTADINSDGRPDIVCIGTTTANLKWYENLGK